MGLSEEKYTINDVLARDVGRGFCNKEVNKEVKSTVRQSVEIKSKQLTIQHNTQDHPQTAENDTRKKMKAVQDSGDPLIIPSVFGSGTVTINPGVVKYLDASHVLDDRLQVMDEQYGLKSHRNGYVLKLSGQADELLSSANLLLHNIKVSVRIRMDIDQFNLILARKLVQETSSITFENDEMVIRGERGNASEIQKVVLDILQNLGKYDKVIVTLGK